MRRAGTAERCLTREATADEAVPVLRSYLRQLRLLVGPYFDVTLASPDTAFAAEAPRHPVFLLTRPSGVHPFDSDPIRQDDRVYFTVLYNRRVHTMTSLDRNA